MLDINLKHKKKTHFLIEMSLLFIYSGLIKKSQREFYLYEG